MKPEDAVRSGFGASGSSSITTAAGSLGPGGAAGSFGASTPGGFGGSSAGSPAPVHPTMPAAAAATLQGTALGVTDTGSPRAGDSGRESLGL